MLKRSFLNLTRLSSTFTPALPTEHHSLRMQPRANQPHKARKIEDFSRNINKLTPFNHILSLRANPSLIIRPYVVSRLNEFSKANLRSHITTLYPDRFSSFLPIMSFLTPPKEGTPTLPLTTDESKIDWISTALIGSHHKQSVVAEIVELIGDRSDDQTLPIDNRDYVMKPPNYNNYNKCDHINIANEVRLADLSAEVDYCHYDMTTLEKITENRYNDIHAYLSKLYKIRKYHPKLQNERIFDQLERDLLVLNSSHNILFSLDLEAFERDNETITEIGITILDPLKSAGSICPEFIKIHLIIDEHKHLRNGMFVPDNQQHFIGGSSIILSQSESIMFIQSLVNHYFLHRKRTHNMNGVIVGHNVSGDLSWLRKMGVVFPEDLLIVDTETMYKSIHGDKFSSLGAILRRFQIPHMHLHNAGNDAYFTLLVLLKLGDVTFRDLKKLDLYNTDMKNIEDFEYLKSRQNGKLKNVRDRMEANKRVKLRGKKRNNNFEFVTDEEYSNCVIALMSVYGKTPS